MPKWVCWKSLEHTDGGRIFEADEVSVETDGTLVFYSAVNGTRTVVCVVTSHAYTDMQPVYDDERAGFFKNSPSDFSAAVIHAPQPIIAHIDVARCL